MGLLTPIGLGHEPFWQSLMAGRSGVKPISSFDVSGLPARFASDLAVA